MTLRLVALMSVVLLLCLAAFGLLVNHYQDQVLDELARTVSEVGRATLRTLEFHRGAHDADSPGVAGNEWTVWHEESADEDGKRPESDVERRVVRVAAEDPELIEIQGEGAFVFTHTDEIHTVTREMEARTIQVECDGEDPIEDCTVTGIPEASAGATRLFVSIEGVRAEPDPGEGLVLKIPTFTHAGGTVSDPAVVDLITAGVGVASPGHATRIEELRLPISTGDYQDLFDSIRRRSAMLFLSVFLVGTVLSAAVAARFTRPVRRLDAAIRRLSEGDLDVQVDTGATGEVGRLSRAFNEMTRSLRANRERSRELVRREKLSALGRLAAGVAHDVRNPLHSIGLTLQHLRETSRPEDPERSIEFDRSMDVIRGEIRRLDQLVSNFLHFARGGPRERHHVDFAELLRDTARLIEKEAEWRGVDVVLSIDEAEEPTAVADGEAIRSAILNLVLNSFEAMPDGGKLTLAVRAEGDDLLVDVGDTGEGIPEKDVERVFDFSYTTRDGGNGLGLAMVHQCIVEDHGGRVSVESAEGDGARIRLSIPRRGTANGEAS